MANFDWQTEVLKALLSILVTVITLGLGWLVGQRLTVFWAIRQKRRELELAAVSGFYSLYGEFFAIWKTWAYCRSGHVTLESSEAIRWSLLERACVAEGKLEAIIVKLASEKPLSETDIEILGKFRQGYQQLRESIRDNKDVGWYSHDQPEYLSFKKLAYLTACIILADKAKKHNEDALVEITTNTWERTWVLSEDDWKRLATHYK